MFANMHNHSTFSDGPYTPEQLVAMARELGHKAIVLTDHDTVQGTYFMQKAARKEGLLTILGCEFTTVEYGEGFHLLGYDFNPDEPEIRKILNHGAMKQRKRTELLLHWAQKKGRCTEVTWQEVCDAYPYNDYLCNNHIFNVLVNKGILTETDYFDFFDPDFKWNPVTEAEIVKRIQMPEPSTKTVIAAIRKAGGVPILAHPHNQLQYIPDLIDTGLMGVEANHPNLNDDEVKLLHEMARERKLYRTGGTDHHGALGGYESQNSNRKCVLSRNCADEQSFMVLYQRILG